MTDNEDIGYTEYLKNGSGIKRYRTTKLVRAWQFGRSQKALKELEAEMGNLDYPGLYILFEGDRKVYVGEAKAICRRLETHTKTPEDKIKNWSTVICLNDGRPATQSDFNDEVVRKALELYLINLFKTNRYTVVSQGEPQNLNPMQKQLVNSLKNELLFFFMKATLVDKDVESREEREVFSDEVQAILKKRGITINHWKEKDAIIDGKPTFVRQGSKKDKGYQITIRGRKPGSFIDCLKSRKGNLLVRRDGVLLIPLTKIRDVIKDDSALEQDTVDIYITFKDEKASLTYKTNMIDVTEYKLSTG
ncbi:MAG: hypothetical protein AB1597_01260 [Chloroflexota bacterium]